jgi:hypothetical protein
MILGCGRIVVPFQFRRIAAVQRSRESNFPLTEPARNVVVANVPPGE